MKKFLFILALGVVIISCKNEKSKDIDLEENRSKSYNQDDGLITMKGEFIYHSDAAILQTKTEIYAVVIDENMHLLEEQVKPFKKSETDMVPVTVRVRKFEKPEMEEGWQYRIEIKDILKVEAPEENKNDVIKLGN